MDPNLFRYVWRHSRRDQLVMLALVVGSLPFYFFSLDLPKRIVNQAIQGEAFTAGKATATAFVLTLPLPGALGGPVTLFEGLQLGRQGLLVALSLAFLALVLVNGGFKYVLNIVKGITGERMLRRMRFDLVAVLLRFPPEDIRGVKPAEAASMVKDEVEPIGGFIGDAFIQPAFLGSQALTALAFILLQNLWLGLLTGAIVGVQGIAIPYLRREQIRLGRERQLASRKLAGRVGELVENAAAVNTHGTAAYERAEIAGRLGQLYDIRYKLYRRKFGVKFLNNLLAQLTPFFFYIVGGWFALRGELDIGQLVAVIAAYRDLPPPIKELIDWDQQRADVSVKYEQILEQFTPEELLPEETADDPAPDLEGASVEARGLTLADARGELVLDGVTLTLESPAQVALIGPAGSGREAFARVLGRGARSYAGELRVAGRELREWTGSAAGRVMAYAGPEAVLFPGSIRDNVAYGLKRRIPDLDPRAKATPEERRRRLEAKRTGNPLAGTHLDWIDYAAIEAQGPEALDEIVVRALGVLGLEEDIYRFGLSGTLDPARDEGLAARLVDARAAVLGRLSAEGKSRLVEPFDPARFNTNATLGENLLFGVPVGEAFKAGRLAGHPFTRAILDAEGLLAPLAEVGARIARETIEMFAGLPPGHPLFSRFSFIAAADLASHEDLVSRWTSRRRSAVPGEDRDRLVALALAYTESRHRLGLVDEALEARIVRARRAFRDHLPPDLADAVEFYDPEAYCGAAPLRDNLLFGRIGYGIAGAGDKVSGVLRAVLRELDLEAAVHRVGLDHEVGLGGRLLTGTQRGAVDLARCLVKRPWLLVVDGAPALAVEGVLGRVRDAMRGRLLVAGFSDPDLGEGFDRVILFEAGRARDAGDAAAQEGSPDPDRPASPAPAGVPRERGARRTRAGGAETETVPVQDDDEDDFGGSGLASSKERLAAE